MYFRGSRYKNNFHPLDSPMLLASLRTSCKKGGVNSLAPAEP